jgi:hypothetical protein
MTDEKKPNKLDMQSIIGNLKNLKNILPHNISEPRPVTGDTLGESLAELSKKAKEAAKMHADITQTLYDIEHGINQLYADIETLRVATDSNASVDVTKENKSDDNKSSDNKSE